MTTPIPDAPNDPVTKQLTYDDPVEVSAAINAWKERDAAQTARIAELEAQIDNHGDGGGKLMWGINASSQKQYDAAVKLFGPGPLAIRYYHQAGEPMTYPSDFTLRPGDKFVLSNKVLPQNMTTPESRQLSMDIVKQHRILLPHQMATSMMLDQFKACPTDRITDWTVWHEPEDDIERGLFTPAQLKDCWHRARQAQQQVGNHIRLNCILMGYTFQKSSKRNPDDFIPAPGDYDILCGDVYFAGNIGQAVSAIPTGYDALIARAKKDGKPWGVTETGVGSKVSGQARLDAIKLNAQTIKNKGALLGCWFTGSGGAWALDSTSVQAWHAGQAG